MTGGRSLTRKSSSRNSSSATKMATCSSHFRSLLCSPFLLCLDSSSKQMMMYKSPQHQHDLERGHPAAQPQAQRSRATQTLYLKNAIHSTASAGGENKRKEGGGRARGAVVVVRALNACAAERAVGPLDAVERHGAEAVGAHGQGAGADGTVLIVRCLTLELPPCRYVAPVNRLQLQLP